MEGYAEVQAFVERYLRDGPPDPPCLSDISLDDLKLQAQQAADDKLWDLTRHYLLELNARGFQPAQTARNLAKLSMEQIRVAESIDWYRRSLALEPNNQADHEALIFTLDSHHDTTDAEALAERRKYFQQFGAHAYAKRQDHRNTPDPDRPLHIGYLGGDWNFHSAAIAFTSVVSNHSANYVPHVYSTLHPNNADRVTDEWRRIFGERFVEGYGLTPSQLAAVIRHDEIDILVDLSGYTSKNRQATLAYRPAPIQAQGWGYVLGSGSPAIDVILGDAVVCSPTVQRTLAERVYLLPSILGFMPYNVKEGQTDLPCLTKPPAFGVFQRGVKINEETLRVWRCILAAVPGSTIMFKGGDYTSDKRMQIAKGLAGLESRITFGPNTTHPEHLNYYQDIDLSLDPWPQTGGVSTLEALYMGVPCITLLGERMIQRTSASFLTTLGLTDFITTSELEYAETAVRMVTTHRERLNAVRKTLRERLMASPIVAGYVDRVEEAYRALWHEWCAGQSQKVA